MTNEVAVKILTRIMNNNFYGCEVQMACKMAIETLSKPSLPSNLDEAEFEYAQSLDEIPANQEEEKMIYDAFKAGAEWRDAQIQKLPNNLDEAAKESAKKWRKNPDGTESRELFFAPYIRGFKVGAKWMAGQGETQQHFVIGSIADSPCGPAVVCYTEEFSVGDEVIVQIRKK